MFVSVSHAHRMLSTIHRFELPSGTLYPCTPVGRKARSRGSFACEASKSQTQHVLDTKSRFHNDPDKTLVSLLGDDLGSTHGSGSRQHSHARDGYCHIRRLRLGANVTSQKGQHTGQTPTMHRLLRLTQHDRTHADTMTY